MVDGTRLVSGEAIVRAVAECEPMVYRDDDYGYDDFVCGFCGVSADVVSWTNREWADVEHEESCQWRRAREWVDAKG